MKKIYNFWLLPYDKFIQDEDNPYSSIDGPLSNARWWVKILMEFNPSANAVIFKAENGRKEYRVERE